MGKTEFIATLIIFNLFLIIFLIGIVLFILQYRLKKKQMQNDLKHREEKYQRDLLATQIEIQSQTMQSIGREIHDNVGQKLTLASIYTQQLAYENKAPNINHNIENISNIVNDALEDLRKLSKTLTNDLVDSHTLSQLLQKLCIEINALKKCKVIFENYSDDIQLNYQEKSVLYRITQEFIQNSLKYSNCKNISINLSHNNKNLKLEILDDGIGFNVHQKHKCIGLQNMQKRVAAIGGNFELISGNKGTQITVNLIF